MAGWSASSAATGSARARSSLSTAAHERTAALFQAKLKGLARTVAGAIVDRGVVSAFPGGAALLAGGEAWVLAEADPARSLGPALGWARRQGASGLQLLASSQAGMLSRRASLFDFPVTVHRIQGSQLVWAAPEPLAPEPPLPPAAAELRPVIEQAGAEPVVEHGTLLAEVRGLEVARVEVAGDGTARLAVGVGKHDREAHQMVGADSSVADRLFRVVRQVLEHRVPGGEGHAAYHLATERWLRWVIVRRPALAGAAELRPVPAPVPRPDLRRPAPAPAAGHTDEGVSVLDVCSAGVDVDLVPAAADAWLADGRQPELVLCLPEGDDHRLVHDQAAILAVPTRVVTVGRDWRAL